MAALLATSDLHVAHPENRSVVEALRPDSDQDWLIVAGDVAERVEDLRWALGRLRERFAQVTWCPGNHELWSRPHDPGSPSGVAAYERMVAACRELGVLAPEDPYATWTGPDGPVVVAPLFALYDYSFRADGMSQDEALAAAYERGVVCTDEFYLDPKPYASREAWCAARVTETEVRLDACDPALPTVLINHWPLVVEPTRVLRWPEFAQWCGTTATADWHTRYRARVVVYGHLHIPRTTWHDGVRFEEVSIGYPREWLTRSDPLRLRRILPEAAA